MRGLFSCMIFLVYWQLIKTSGFFSFMCDLGWLKILTNLERFLWQKTWRPCGWNKQGKLITSCPLFVPPLFKIKYTWHHLSYSTRFYLKVDLYGTFGSISCDLIRTGQINWTPRFVSTTSLFCISREEEEEKEKRTRKTVGAVVFFWNLG